MEFAGFQRAHAGDARALLEHAGDIGVEEHVDAVLARRLGVGVGQAEGAYLVVAQEFQRAGGFMADIGLVCTQLSLVHPAHLVGQMGICAAMCSA